MKKLLSLCVIVLLFINNNSLATEWASIEGTIEGKDGPLCALVLANGQFQFTCDPIGEWSLSPWMQRET